MYSVLPDLLRQMDKIISLPSISSANKDLDMSNKPVIDHLATSFLSMGFKCEIIPCDPAETKFNLIATLGTGPGGLVLAGHTDTVPFDQKLWSVDPFQLTEKGNKIYGLGVTDMKGFFPIVMDAVKPLLDEKFKEPLIVLATADEESSMLGAKALVKLGRPKARSALIGEPTELKPVSAHKGIMMDRIRLLGESGHSSDPSLGKNALDTMHQVISELVKYRNQLKERYSSELFVIPYPTLNLGAIHGGDNPNRICGHCDLEFDIRLVPGMNIDTVRAEINKLVKSVTEPSGVEFKMEEIFSGVPAFFAEENSKMLKTAEELTGHGGVSVLFGTEGPFLQQLGMDTIVMGPGNIDQAHQPNEYMSMDMINPTIKVLKKLISANCF
ncbi:MAG: acetylornithine deacetylase [Gammaproteobacteria bacterium]|nr:acetylornithine deacetylase [Gammaproteobacteria bacterium]